MLPTVDHFSERALHSAVFAMLGESTEALRADRKFVMAYTHLRHVTDKAVREYLAAEESVRNFDSIGWSEWETLGHKGQHLRLATDHLETCLDATHRGISTALLLRKHGFGKGGPLPDQDAFGRLKRIRNTVQHTPDRLLEPPDLAEMQRGRLPFGSDDPYGIRLLQHELTIGSDKPLTYGELVGLMENCYLTAQDINDRGQSDPNGHRA